MFRLLVLATLCVGCGNNKPSVVYVTVTAPGNSKSIHSDERTETSETFDVDRFIAESKVQPKEASLVHSLLSGPDAVKYKSLINQRFRIRGKLLAAEGDIVLIQIGQDDMHNIAKGKFSKMDEYAIAHDFQFNDTVIFEGACKGISEGQFQPGWVVKSLDFVDCFLDEREKDKKSMERFRNLTERGSKSQDNLNKLTDEMKQKYGLPK